MRAAVVRTRALWRNLTAIATTLLVLGLASAPPAGAVVHLGPWGGNLSHLDVHSQAGNVTDQNSANGAGPGTWQSTLSCDAYDAENEIDAAAVMSFHTQFDEYTFYATSFGVSAVDPGGTSAASAILFVWFTLDWTHQFVNSTTISDGTLPTNHSLAALVNFESADVPLINLVAGTSGRLAPGTYAFYYYNYFGTTTASGTSNTLTALVDFSSVAVPLVQQHPQGQTVSPGSNASFSVGASGQAAAGASTNLALTYQWRYRYQNLADGGRISGAHTSQLHIANVAVADTGIYDCVVTQGTIEEPSSVARLRVSGTAGVGDSPATAGLLLSNPAPSPFRSHTRVSFSLPVAGGVSLDVLDVSGRRVRSLLDGEWRSAGTQAIEWDGRSDRGDAAPAGLYFVRLAAGGEQRVQRAVRIAP